MEQQCQPCGSYKAHEVPFRLGEPQWHHGNRCHLYIWYWTGWSIAIGKQASGMRVVGGHTCASEFFISYKKEIILFPFLSSINYCSLCRTWMWFGWTETSFANLICEAHMINFPPALSDRRFKSNETFLRFHWQLLKLRRQGKRSGESRLMWKLDRDISEPSWCITLHP